MNSRDILSKSIYVRLEVTGEKKKHIVLMKYPELKIVGEWESIEREKCYTGLSSSDPFWNILMALQNLHCYCLTSRWRLDLNWYSCSYVFN